MQNKLTDNTYMRKPVVNNPPAPSRRPVATKTKQSDGKWKFSFRFWRQIDYFGLTQATSKWFVSFLERLQSISNEKVDDFITNPRLKTNYRYHSINWSQKNIPIQRKELTWLHKDYLDNEQEFPLIQFQVSKALGRIVGFFDEEKTFNIVLLDPLHNIQPSKYYNYKVDSCYPLACELTSLTNTLLELTDRNDCPNPSCNLVQGLKDIEASRYSTNIVMFNANDIDIRDADNIIKNGKCASYTDIFQLGIVASIEIK